MQVLLKQTETDEISFRDNLVMAMDGRVERKMEERTD